MKISLKGFVGFLLAAILCFGLWYKFGFPKLIFMDMAVDKSQAITKAKGYLEGLNKNFKDYKIAVTFKDDEWADRYLQKTLGLLKQEEFLKQQNFEIFYWRIRFFKQYQKEEYVVKISCQSGKVLGFEHLIDDIESRVDLGKFAAQEKAESFLKKAFGFDRDLYKFHKEESRRYDNRIDYIFSWEKIGSYVPWKNNEGAAKILIGATVSGDEIREFYLAKLDIPEKFKRYLEKELNFGQHLSSFSSLGLIIFLICSTAIAIRRRATLSVKLSRKAYFYLAGFIGLINLIDVINNFENLITYYPTSINYASFVWLNLFRAFISVMFIAAAFIFPALAGESLSSEVFPQAKHRGLLHYVKSSFFSRSVSKSIIFGYLIFLIMIGLQAVMFYLGQKYFGVWKEWVRFTQFSSVYLPFFSAFVVGVIASLNEEIMFRLFGISWAAKYLKNIFLAVLLSSLVWGFGHAGYAIFPVWFRGVEVTIIGLFLGFIFLRFGLIVVLIAHYLFDVFWGVATYIFGISPPLLFYGSVFMLALPLIFALIIYFINKEDKEEPIKILLDNNQKYNLEILVNFIILKKSQGSDPRELEKELVRHNWDPDLVKLSMEKVYGNY